MSATPILGIDWGTTNRRAYLLDQHGRLLRQHSDAMGILAIEGNFEQALADLLQLLELTRVNVLMSGMVGSRNGWTQVPYLSIEHSLRRLPQALVPVATTLPEVQCRIVPGYRFIDRHGLPDVMRGEETQLLGALMLGAADGWFVMPGTHSKWVHTECNGTVTDIMSFMTGELYALLSKHGTLATLMQEPADVPAAFAAGLEAAQCGGFTHMAFCCRALVVTDKMPASHAASYLSGLLIGAEIRDVKLRSAGSLQAPVQVIGSASLSVRYVAALKAFGVTTVAWQPDESYVAALHALANPQAEPR